MTRFQPRIAIVGGGPAGLALGLLLSRRGVQCIIYELRDKPTAEELAEPSGMLDLHEESGLAVIRECGLWDDFQAAVGDCSEAMRLLNSDGVVLHTDEGELSNRPEISRNALTKLLLKNMPEGVVKWGQKITEVRSEVDESTAANEISLDIGQQGTATCNFVVGADGAWSKVRLLISNAKPEYSGIQLMTSTVRYASTNFPYLVDLVGSGSFMALGGRNGLMTHRGPQDSIHLYTCFSAEDQQWPETQGLKGQTTAEMKKMLLRDDKLFRTWAPRLQDLITTTCDGQTKDHPGREAEIWPLHMLPVGHRWKQHRAATLVGDAAHLMTPFAGEGVNLALWDSLDLANVLSAIPNVKDATEWQSALEPKLQDFEETMQARAEEKAEETARNKDLCFGENAAQVMADVFKMHFQDPVDIGKGTALCRATFRIKISDLKETVIPPTGKTMVQEQKSNHEANKGADRDTGRNMTGEVDNQAAGLPRRLDEADDAKKEVFGQEKSDEHASKIGLDNEINVHDAAASKQP